jgi:hydroxyacid-oxoacid transhydrogenase
MSTDRVFSVSASNLVFGPGARHETGDHAADMGLSRVMVLTDPNLADGEIVADVRASLQDSGIDHELFAEVRVEPSYDSFMRAAEAARAGAFDGFIAVGGGSTMDTAKAANLYASWPADLMDYVNPPIGRGLPPPGPLRPLICLPTTAGTGSETTGVAIFDLPDLHAKTGIAHRRLRPSMGIIDPEATHGLPPTATACCGFDVLCHALESYTALRSDRRPSPPQPRARPAYQGGNPYSDIWAERTLGMLAEALPRAYDDGGDAEARTAMSLAATFAGIGFGNAGVHLAHGMSYAVSGMVREYSAAGYPADHALVPHGMSVVLNAPAVFRFTASADPERHLRAAALLGAEVAGAAREDAGELLATTIAALMRRTDMPNGIGEVGYRQEDIPALTEATLPQHRVTKLSPRPVERADLSALFAESMRIW